MNNETASARRRQLSLDRHRPIFHFLPPSNWMNDPNGVIQWKGKYHLFYQYNPFGPLWGNMHWGHAVSDDLVHWADLPLALAPSPDGPDEAGCFSGCAVDNGVPTIIYTGTRGERNEIQTQCLATSIDDLLTWQKYTGNPVLSQVPLESGQMSDFRDPFVWREGDVWYMVLGSRIKDVGGAIFLYRSLDLIEWEYVHPLLVGDIRRNGALWECPNFFKLGEQWILLVSANTGQTTDTVFYFVGRYEGHRFTPTSEGVLDYAHLYAPLTMADDQGRRILFGWLREARSTSDQRLAGWSGVQSIPRILQLDDRGRLLTSPVPGLETIRGKQFHLSHIDLSGQKLIDVTGNALDIVAEFAPQPEGQCGLVVACSSDRRERTEIVFDAARQTLIVRKVEPDRNGSVNIHIREVPHPLDDNEQLRLRILLDGSVVEVIANHRTSVSSRIYPSQPDCTRVLLVGTNAHLRSLDIWEMPSIWQ